MAHRIRFTFKHPENQCILTRAEVIDLIELLYRWDDSSFHIVFAPKHKKWAGLAQWNSYTREHTVTIYDRSVRVCFEKKIPVGGSIPAPSLRAAAGLVLAHELQHCNQVKLYQNSGKSSFYSQHHYWNLPSEREARGFADEKLNEICAYFGVDPVGRRPVTVRVDPDELDQVVELLAGCDRVTRDDVNAELRASKLSSPANFTEVKRRLADRGIEVNAR